MGVVVVVGDGPGLEDAGGGGGGGGGGRWSTHCARERCQGW